MKTYGIVRHRLMLHDPLSLIPVNIERAPERVLR
jgi:hypothetical protein